MGNPYVMHCYRLNYPEFKVHPGATAQALALYGAPIALSSFQQDKWPCGRRASARMNCVAHPSGHHIMPSDYAWPSNGSFVSPCYGTSPTAQRQRDIVYGIPPAAITDVPCSLSCAVLPLRPCKPAPPADARHTSPASKAQQLQPSEAHVRCKAQQLQPS